ncbi:MAG TPA: lamin tail domain-containing protein [Polyangiaceae bacterium]|nr:lamin tail domain-containing protein [Polyangiaceae bacterium]
MRTRFGLGLLLSWWVAALACGGDGPEPRGNGGSGGEGGSGGAAEPGELVINEVMAQNDGAWIDAAGEADDWVELINRSQHTLSLADYRLADAKGNPSRLPDVKLGPGQGVLLWTDDDPKQGPGHLPFKLSSSGDHLTLLDAVGTEIDAVDIPALDVNYVYARFPNAEGAFRVCRYASPGRVNGDACAPAPVPSLVDDVKFAPFDVPEPFPEPPRGLVLNELALRPADGSSAFVELANRGDTALALDGVLVRVSPHGPSLPWPSSSSGSEIALPAGQTLAPGQLLELPVSGAALGLLESDPAFEGVVTIFDRASGGVLDRVDFMRWPTGAALARNPASPALLRFCTNSTPGAENACDVLPSRDVGDRLRNLYTPGDFAALAIGADAVGIESTKFVIDLQAPGLVHFIGSTPWPLHYTFVRERVYQEPHLDRCDPAQNAEFYDGWVDFSDREYYSQSTRRFHLGTLSHYGSVDLRAIEFTYGDAISGSQMRDAYQALLPHLDDPRAWVLHPQDTSQVSKARAIEGTVPLVGPDAPFEGMTYQSLSEGVAYGMLKFVPAEELWSASLGPKVIAITDDVPNDVPYIGGLITESFQTPLAHVNVLSENRGTPNAALVDARNALSSYLDQLVKLVVGPGGIEVTLAEPAEAEAFWASRAPKGEPVSPSLDTSVRGIQDLAGLDLSSLPFIGAKAAQMAELLRVVPEQVACLRSRPFVAPTAPFAIPMVHYLEHFQASGAQQLLAELEADPRFAEDPALRAQGLAQVQQRMLDYPVDPELSSQVNAALSSRFGKERVRFRSSSNTEDLPDFNGAGLHTSTSGELDDPERSVPDALRTVWASLWNARAYDERSNAGIRNDTAAMGVLVHPATLGEGANGVGVSRNILEPIRGDQFYVNAQLGEASVTNPAPAVSTEQLIYQWNRTPAVLYQSESSLLNAYPVPPEQVLSPIEVEDVVCALTRIHQHFRPLIDPEQKNRWFAMQIEFKFVGPERRLLVKQARPHTFGHREIIADCREF